MHEDLGSSYGAGSYGLSVFDNLYKLYLNTGTPGTQPEIVSCVPDVPSLRFHNYLTSAPVKTDSAYIVGAPFAADRYLYGALPANKNQTLLRGDIPDPPLFLAQYLYHALQQAGMEVEGNATSLRLLREEDKAPPCAAERKTLVTTYSPALRELLRITNERSHNLYADALLKILGETQYSLQPNEVISSAGKGIQVLHSYWQEKGIDTSPLRMFDGSGLAITNKLTASFLCELLAYMATQSDQKDVFAASLPQAGLEGTVAALFKGSPLVGKALLKSGGMSRVRTYAGYITKGNEPYAVALFTHDYSCTMQEITKEIETLFLSLFK
jgi:D-alanyl-D-alanine carboxypeptidase/D-alanyl-D-alanine-endopeptidase (penicillin-binding protein 4)